MKPVKSTEVRVRPRPEIDGLSAYRLRQAAAIKLNQNESPFDWPPDLKADVLARLSQRAWNRYPPVDGEELRIALARFCGVNPQMIAVTNGSNEAILALVETFAGGKTVVLPTPEYSMARPLAVIGGATVNAVPLRLDFALDVERMVRAVEAPEASMVFLASPNNPTGNAFSPEGIEAIIEAAQGLVVLDEAYVSFSGRSFINDLPRYPHLAILRTFSKAFALAGARVGWIVAGETVVAAVRKALPPYNLNVFAQEVAIAALQRPDLVSARVELMLTERRRVTEGLRAVDGVTPFPSDANFILFRTDLPAPMLFERLLQQGVLVRDVSSASPLLERCLRVSIGTPQENDRFLEAIRTTLGGV